MKISDLIKIIGLALLIAACNAEDVEPKSNESQLDIVEIDNLVQAMMSKYKLPGASLAISKNEQLVYLKSYGVADTTTKEMVKPENIFRISGLSQTYTSVAIFKLIEENKLKLTDKVFGEGSILGTKHGSKTYPSQLKTITVSHLLQNSSGTFRNNFDQDMINNNKTIAKEGYIDWVLDNMSYQFQPGTAYKFTNFNYFLLALIIEEKTNQPYFEYLKESVLKNINDNESVLAKNDVRLPLEVKYIGQGRLKFAPYTFSLEGFLGSASMVSNPRSILKLVHALDEESTRKDILNAKNIKDLKTVATSNTKWSNGIMQESNILYRNEYLAGSKAAWMYNKGTKIASAIVFNSNIDYLDQNLEKEFSDSVQQLNSNFVSTNRNFQNIDQF